MCVLGLGTRQFLQSELSDIQCVVAGEDRAALGGKKELTVLCCLFVKWLDISRDSSVWGDKAQ